jgi:hypothetical protein
MGEKGVWNEPLDPGMYPINPYTLRVELVPTASVVLNWADGKTEAHDLDKDLLTITVRSSDGFKFNLDVSQIETAKALSASGFKLVPDIVAGDDGGGSNSLINIFLARLVKDSNGTSNAKP